MEDHFEKWVSDSGFKDWHFPLIRDFWSYISLKDFYTAFLMLKTEYEQQNINKKYLNKAIKN